MISWTWLSSCLKALLAAPRWASDFSSSKLKSVVFFFSLCQCFFFILFFASVSAHHSFWQSHVRLQARQSCTARLNILPGHLLPVCGSPLCLLVPLRAETSQSVESEKWSIDYAARSLKGTPDHWAMTARGHRSQKGPVHGEVSLRKGNAALFMSLYYVRAESFFFYPDGNPNKQVIQKKKKKKKDEEMPGWGGNGNETAWVKGVDGRRCGSGAGVRGKISWVSPRRWFLAAPAPGKLNIDQSLASLQTMKEIKKSIKGNK